MKNNKLTFLKIAIVAILGFATVLGCKKSETTLVDEKSVMVAQIDSSILAKIENMGFQIEGIKEYDAYYLVEDDILISKKTLSASTKLKSTGSTIFQSRTSDLVGSQYEHNINIGLDASIWTQTNWYNGLLKAITIWNSTSNSDIKLNLIYTSLLDYSYDPSRIDIVIRTDNNSLASNVAAVAEFPDANGNPGSLILVNSNIVDPYTSNYFTEAQATWNIIHEIGHCLGLRHTNWYYRGESANPEGAFDIVGTPGALTGDANSVMNGGTALSSYSSLFPSLPSNYDAVAISALYAFNVNSSVSPYISGNKYFSSYGEDYFTMSYMEYGLSYTWSVVGVNGTVYSDTIGTFSTPRTPGLGFPVGNYQLQCTISGGKYSMPITATKNIVVQ